MADNRIEGRLALVTGASGGIGGAIAKELAGAGCHLAMTYSSSKDAATDLQSSLQSKHPDLRITVHQVNMGATEQIDNLYAEIKQQHNCPVDILISNAGYGKRIVDIWDIPLEEFDHTININLRAPFILVKGCVEAMKAQRWGRIIFVNSIAGHGGGINGCHYAASKGGATAMVKNLSNHLAKFNISVNDVAPAMIGATGMIPSPEKVPGVVETIPLGRFGEPIEVAQAVEMFARSGYITGQSLIIGGGLK